ncbi:MAG: NADH-quinone oxidoreductase subunit J [Myxococcales bacterium]|nr:NADH-quinone oxidoreductase subunit J [Myxococcales bacterium]USN50862.1 MAG: NADH-quinone oxidoreductase subunit J [Myxococcales bacterium]
METGFYIHASMAIVAMAFAMTLKHTVHALIAMVSSLLFLAVALYFLSAPLAAGLLVIVYAGAIMVLFAFAVMLLQLPISNGQETSHPKNTTLLSLLIFGLFWGELSLVLDSHLSLPSAGTQEITDIARALFIKYGFLVELTSMLLLAGLLSAIYVALHLMARTNSLEPKKS